MQKINENPFLHLLAYSIVFISEFQGHYNQGGCQVIGIRDQQRAKFLLITLNTVVPRSYATPYYAIFAVTLF